MKMCPKIIAIIAILAGLAVGFGIVNRTHSSELFMAQVESEIPHDIEYTLNANTNNIPSKEKIYVYTKPNVNESIAKSLAIKFNVDGIIKNQGNAYLIKDNNDNKKVFEINKESGYFSYMNFNKLGNLDIEKSIPKDSVAIAKAKEYLTERGLLQDRFIIVKVTNRTTGEKLTGTERIVSKEVWFYPTVDGKPVYGVSRIIVSVGHEGEIEAVRKYHRDFESSEEVTLKSFDEAFNELKNGKASINISEKAKEAKINNVGIAYWEDPYEDKLHPVYLFQGETVIDGNIEKFDAFLPAARGVVMKAQPHEPTQEVPDTQKPMQ